MDAVNDIFDRYSGAAGGTASAPADPHQDYRDIAETAPPQVMADALAHTFRSDQTPSFPEMVSSLFRQSNSDQRAGLLNQLIGAIGPTALASIPGLKELMIVGLVLVIACGNVAMLLTARNAARAREMLHGASSSSHTQSNPAPWNDTRPSW